MQAPVLLVRSSIHLNAVIRKSMQHRIECVLMHSTSSEEDGARLRLERRGAVLQCAVHWRWEEYSSVD